MNLKLEKSGEGFGPIAQNVRQLQKASVLVGIPQQNGPRRKGKISNAELLFIHSNGSPLRGIPRRPVIEPAIENPPTAKRIDGELGKSAEAGLDGDRAGMLNHLDKAGTIGESAAKRWFTDPANGWPPNKKATIRAKLRSLRGQARKDADAALAAGEALESIDTPLIRTGQMRRAITHVLEE